MWIKNIVQDLINKHQTNDPFVIARQSNIFVIEHDLHEDIYGFYRYVRRNKFIFINSNIATHKKYHVCGHELGHSTLHPDLNTPFMKKNTLLSVDKIELEANRFAAELLIPDESFIEYNNFYDIASLHNVPVELVRLKYEKLFFSNENRTYIPISEEGIENEREFIRKTINYYGSL